MYNQIAAKLIKAGGRTIHSEMHKLINSIWNYEKLPEKWKDSIILLIYKKGDVMKSGNLNFLEPYGPLQACNRTALPL